MPDRIRLETYSYRFADQVLNANLAIKHEIETVLQMPTDFGSLSRPRLNEVLNERFTQHGWQAQPPVFGDAGDPTAKMDFLKNRIGMEVEFGHSSFIGIDLLKLQVASYSGLDKIDLGVYVVTTRLFQKTMKEKYGQNWEGSLTFEKVARYLPHFRSAIQVPVYVIGIDL